MGLRGEPASVGLRVSYSVICKSSACYIMNPCPCGYYGNLWNFWDSMWTTYLTRGHFVNNCPITMSVSVHPLHPTGTSQGLGFPRAMVLYQPRAGEGQIHVDIP